MKRIEFIDVAKGITILLVIVGHTIPEGLMRTLIYSFHMPLFFFLSGYFYRNIPTKVLIRKKARQLLPPYYITSACLIIFNAGMLFIRQKTDELFPSTARLFFAALYGSGMDIHSPFPIPQIGAIWFLWALFFCFILMNLLYPLRYQPVLLILLAVLGIYSSWRFLDFTAFLFYGCHFRFRLPYLPSLFSI
ncbi:putative uncharacterized protein [Blautia hydrogenotrophica CAG:147]|uniref:acyltransferase family protein n=1 Tax=Blautia hydrogenotrophica TaxID=53443 RepID=UPI0003388EC3|nr:acyltransferase family protein [Blautia hydrogenotrophica]CCX59757.1 putative uncharacterized protein [Blautia hydrogenotrophica CAG:147]